MKHSARPGFTPDVKARLDAFVELLRRWTLRINLVGRADAADIWERHIIDSAQLAALLTDLPVVPADATILDLGAGAGFPGLVLGIVTGRRVHLVEADQRKAGFLREAARVCEADAVIHAERIERLSLPSFHVVTARALAPLPVLLGFAAPVLRPDGICLFLKGRTAEAELTQARRQWQMQVERFPSCTNPDATIFRLREVARVQSIG